MRSKIAVTMLLSLLIFGAGGCDSFSLLDHFNKNDGLSLTLQKSSISPGQGTTLYPSGGTEPYSFVVIEEDRYYSDGGVPGGITDQKFTAGNFIGKVSILLTDANGYRVESTVTIIPPTPTDFDAIPGGSSTIIDLSWTYSKPDMIIGFRIEQSEEGEPFEVLPDSIGKDETGHSDGSLSPNTYYTYRIYAVAGDDEEYVSWPSPIEGTTTSGP